MKLVFSLAIILIYCLNPLLCQVIKTNDKGVKIIEYPDGSWKYFSSSDPSDVKLEANQYSISNNADSDLYSHIQKLYQASVDKEKLISKNKEDNRTDKVMLEFSLNAQKKELSTSEIAMLKEKINTNKENERALNNTLKSTQKETKAFFAMLNMESEKRAKAYLKYLKSISKDKGLYIKKEYAGKGPVTEKVKVTETNNNTTASLSDSKDEIKHKQTQAKPAHVKVKNAVDYYKYNESADPYKHPISKPCNVEAEGKDEFTGKNRKDLVAEQWFFLTPEQMKKSLQDKEYLNVTASLSSISGGTVFLTINITIASLDAPRLFGGLEKGSVINIKFLDGDNIAIINNRNDFGTVNSTDRTISYRAQCTLGSAIQDMIATKEVDKIRLTWNAGYEDYEVYDIDLLMRQMSCLK